MKIGYARVSTEDQNFDMQIDALNEANGDHIVVAPRGIEPRTHGFSVLCCILSIRHLRGSVTKYRPFSCPNLFRFVP